MIYMEPIILHMDVRAPARWRSSFFFWIIVCWAAASRGSNVHMERDWLYVNHQYSYGSSLLSILHAVLLKFGFCKKSLRKNETLTSWTLLQHICPHFWSWLLLYSAITPKSENKYVVKVFNWSEFHLSEMTLLQNPYFSIVSVPKRCKEEKKILK